MKNFHNWTRQFVITLVLLSMTLGTAQAMPLAEPAIAQAYLVIPDRRLVAGETIRVEMWLAEVEMLFGADIQISFDASAFQVVDADLSTPTVNVNPRTDLLESGFTVKNEVNNSLGSIWYATSMVYPSEPVYGSGALFEFEMTVLKDGVYPFVFSNAQLSTNGGDVIPVQAQTSIVIVGYPLYLPLIIRGN